MNFGHLSLYLQVEQIVLLVIHIIGVISIVSLIHKFHSTVEFSSACQSKPLGMLMHHCKRIAMGRIFDKMLTTQSRLFRSGAGGPQLSYPWLGLRISHRQHQAF